MSKDNLTATLGKRYDSLMKKKAKGTWTNNDFIGVWDALNMIVLLKIEQYINGSVHTKEGYTKEEAVIYGHLARVFDLLKMQRRMVLTDSAVREILKILGRSIMETSVTLEYILKNNSQKMFDDYIMDSMRMTTAYEDIVLENIANSGGKETEMEKSILFSIEKEREKCGLTRKDVDDWSKNKSMLIGFHGRFKAVGKLDLYNIAYKTGSQSVHGNWEALSKNYLDYSIETGRFKPDLSDDHIDIRLVNPGLHLVIEVLQVFLKVYECHGLGEIDVEALEHLKTAVKQLGDEHEVFLDRVSW
jgi:hypothetical protein